MCSRVGLGAGLVCGEPALLEEMGLFFTLGVSEHWNRLHRSCEITILRDGQKLSGHSPGLELNHTDPRAVVTSGTLVVQ